MEKSEYPRGSEWRKWDLHIHTPDSIYQNYGQDKWEDFITALEKLPKDVKVVGITDYYFLDGYEKVINEKLKKGRLKNIEKIFPILEFRIDTFASASETNYQKVNLHILFDLDESSIANEINKVRKEFIEQVHLTKLKEHQTKILSKQNLIECSSDGKLKTGFEDLIPNTDEVLKLVESTTWRDKTLLLLGYKEWNNLDKGKQLKVFKKDVCNKSSIFLSASKIDSFEKKKDFLNTFGEKQLIHSLDIHGFNSLKEYECYTWIKADPSFEGLKQILYEPERLFIGIRPPKLGYYLNNKECYIDNLKINTTKNNDEWFDKINHEIPFNSSLVSIIGNKGHGKSALADILASLSNASQNEYSFLNSNRFLSFERAGKYSAEIKFTEAYKNQKQLIEAKYNPREAIKAKYLSQHFVNNICDDLNSSNLQEEINKVVFFHLPEEVKSNYEDLDTLVKNEINSIENNLDRERKNLSKLNKEIADAELMLSETEIETLKNLLKSKQAEIKAQEKPKTVKKPKEGKIIDELVIKKEKAQSGITKSQKKINELSKEKNELNKVNEEFKNIEDSISELYDEFESNSVIKKHKLNMKRIFTYRFDYVKIEERIKKISDKIKAEEKYRKEKNKEVQELDSKIEEINKTANKQQKEYNDYKKNIDKWKKKKAELRGAKNREGTLLYFEEKLRYAKNELPNKLLDFKSKRDKRIEKIVNLLLQKQEVIPTIFKSAQEYADKKAKEFEINKDEFILFDSKIKLSDKFFNEFYDQVNCKRKGSYFQDSDQTILKSIISDSSLKTKGDMVKLAKELENSLKRDYRNDENDRDLLKYEDVVNQLRSKELNEVYDYIYSFNYIDTEFDITYGGKSIKELSPGERGTLLLIFYLLIDQDKNPIIIDQPEENLDNETIYQKLVPFIKKVKEERQVIIVTHNPNLAIVCDSEQIIHAHIDKKNNNLVSYNSGSIEYHGIRDKAIAILEGTEPAFTNRKNKYHL